MEAIGWHFSSLKNCVIERFSVASNWFLFLPANLQSRYQAYNSSGTGSGVPTIPASSQKRLDDGAARFTSANFQEVSSTLSGSSSKDTLSADAGKAVVELKNKKSSSGGHAVGQRGGRKSLTSSGKALPSAVVTMATPTSASASTGPFHQGELMVENEPLSLIFAMGVVCFV